MSVNPIPPPPPSECGDAGLDSGMNSPVISSAAISPVQDKLTSSEANSGTELQTISAPAVVPASVPGANPLGNSSVIAGSRSTLTGTPVPQPGNSKAPTGGNFTKVLYYFDDVETPYLIKVPSCNEAANDEPSVTLGAFKTVVNKANCKYFVKTMDQELRQTVKEEVMDDNALLPLYNGRIIVYVNSIENSSSHGGGGGSQSGGALSGGESNAPHHTSNRLSGGAGSGHGGSQGGNQFGNNSDTGSQYNDIGDLWNTMRTPASGGNSHIGNRQQSYHMKNQPYGKGRYPPAPQPLDEDDYTTATDTESFVQHPKGGLRGPPPSAIMRYGQQSRNYMHYDVDMGGAGYDSGATSQFTTDYESSFIDSTTDDDESIYRLAGPGGYGGGGYWKHQHKMQPPGRPKRPHRPRRQRGQPGTRIYIGGLLRMVEPRLSALAPSIMSSITDSCSSLNLQTVVINMDSSKHLGISIVGQSTNDGAGDGGIYVGEITRDGAVYQEGSIDPGDLIIQANDTPFTNMSNDDAVKVLRDLAKKPGPLKLVVAKLWNSDPAGFDGDGGGFGSPEYYSMEPRTDLPLHPIDPASWVEASRIATLNGTALSPAVTSDEGGSEIGAFNYSGKNNMGPGMVPGGGQGGPVNAGGPGMVDQMGGQMHQQGSNLNRQSTGQGGSTGSAPELREYNGNNGVQMGGMQPHMMQQHPNQMQQGMSMHASSTGVYSPPYIGALRTNSDPALIITAMMMPNSGLEIKDRMWLKITIPNAFLGRHFVQWLYEKVAGFSSRNESRTMAKRLLKEGYLKHTTGKSTFSEQCYYVFNLERISSSSAPSAALYGAGTMSTLQSTLDSSQFGGGPGSNVTGPGGGVGMIDTTTTDNNSSHDGSEENNDQLPPLPSSMSSQGPHAPWNLVAPPYTGYNPPSAMGYNGANMYNQGGGGGAVGVTYSMYNQQPTAQPQQTQAKTPDFMSGATTQLSYSSNVTPMHHHHPQQQLATQFAGGGGGSNLSESRMPLLMMNNTSSPGGPQSQIRKDFVSQNNPAGANQHQGANDSIFANVM
ncbi:uncharacterized protein LOC142342327 isoform X2 [Convolutriloba macropyga]|uniref:uncharacterized protein LOC142342327 isoform X2 n=1 Tax=Convolutriloba macropyga TaxID=536237 RepID=UPI003F528847